MSIRYRLTVAVALCSCAALNADWPQWRGSGRDGKSMSFKAPTTWPKEPTQKWKVTVGDGVATPALVGDKLYVFSREGDRTNGREVTRCLNAQTGKEMWIDRYEVAFRPSADQGFPGPRSSPAVANGKVVTLGVNGTLSCLDADTGQKRWRIETKGFPRFHTSSSPLVVEGIVIAQFGSERDGGITAYQLADGSEKWKWSESGTAYASPVVMDVDDTQMLVAMTSNSVVGLRLNDGKQLWSTPFVVTGRGYNASTPIVKGQTVIFSGSSRGTKALKIQKSGDEFAAKELWHNKDISVMYNTPVVHGNMVFGLTSNNKLFGIKAESGATGWSVETKGRGGYGSIVDAGSVLVSLTPAGRLVVYEPSDTEFKEVASYKVADTETYAYPVVDGNRAYVKDKDSVTLWTLE